MNQFVSRSTALRLAASALLLVVVGLGLALESQSAQAAAAKPTAAGKAQLIASPEPGWPQWRGPRRDGISDETGLLQSWPEGGPKLLWSISGLGRGYSAPIITRGRIYITGDVGDELIIFALDLEGRRLWQTANGRAWKGPHPGARACCAYRDGRLFHLNAHGRLACLDAATGKELWAVDVLERFGGKNFTWGISECVLVDGSRVIVKAAGTKALLAALDAQTGQTVWTTEPLVLGKSEPPAHVRVAEPDGDADSAGYASAILFRLGGRRHLVNCSLRHVFGADADTGKLLWSRPIPTRYEVVAATPTLCEDAVFVTAPDSDGRKLYRLRASSADVNVEEVWSTKLDTCHGCLVYLDGSLYGSWYRQKGWACLDARTGEVRYTTDALAKGSVSYADGRLYCLSEEGEMFLIKPTPTGFEFTGRFRLVPDRQSDVWAHPVILDRKLYLRYHDALSCYNIRAK